MDLEGGVVCIDLKAHRGWGDSQWGTANPCGEAAPNGGCAAGSEDEAWKRTRPPLTDVAVKRGSLGWMGTWWNAFTMSVLKRKTDSPGFASRVRCRMPLATSASRGRMTRSDWRAMELTPERLRPKKCDDSTCWDVVY